MNKKDLLSFISINEEQSFTKAAEKLHITQPALSKRIARLEEQFGSNLLDRSHKQIRLSEAGKIFQQHAYKLINSINNCETEINNLQNTVSGSLRLGVSHHIGLHRLPQHLQKFTEIYPDVQLKISFVDSEKAYEMISKNELEVALATLSPNDNPSITSINIWDDPLAFVCNKQHPLRYKQRIKYADLCAHPAVLPSEDTYTGQLVQRRLLQSNCSLEHLIETNYLETIKMMTSIGIGWSVLPTSMLSNELTELPLPGDSLHRKLGVIHSKNMILSNVSKAFIDILPLSL